MKDAFTNALADVLADASLRSEMSARGLEQAKRFSWEKSARDTLAVYQEAAA